MLRIKQDFKHYDVTELSMMSINLTDLITSNFEEDFMGVNLTSPYYLVTINEYDMFGYCHNPTLLSWNVCCNVLSALFKDAIDVGVISELEDKNINLIDNEIIVDYMYPGDRSMIIINTNYITPYKDEIHKFIQSLESGQSVLEIKFNTEYKPYQYVELLPSSDLLQESVSGYPYYGSLDDLKNAIQNLTLFEVTLSYGTDKIIVTKKLCEHK